VHSVQICLVHPVAYEVYIADTTATADQNWCQF